MAKIQSFVQGMEYDRSLATVVVAEFCEPPSPFLEEIVRALLARFRAAHSCVTDTSVVASFDGPARAGRYACCLQRTLGEQRCGTRIGLHTGSAAARVRRCAGRQAQPGLGEWQILRTATANERVGQVSA